MSEIVYNIQLGLKFESSTSLSTIMHTTIDKETHHAALKPEYVSRR